MTTAQAAPAAAAPPEQPRVLPKKSLVVQMADRLNVDADKLMRTLKDTAFRQREDDKGNRRIPTDEEMMALLIIAENYKLNPFTKELFAYFDPKSGAIVPVVSVDGWIRITNAQPTLRSLSFRFSDETLVHKEKTCHVWMEVEIVRSDRDKPIIIREYFAEVVRKVSFATPWDSHPNRMHRHKTLIQGARVAFGFGGIYDEDEAQRILDNDAARPESSQSAGVSAINAQVGQLEHNPGEKVPPMAIDGASQRVSEGVEQEKTDDEQQQKTSKIEPPTKESVATQINNARSIDELNLARDLIRSVDGDQHKRALNLQAAERDAELRKGSTT